MEAGLDEASAEVLQLLPGLYEQIPASRWELYSNALAGVACPDIETRITGAAVDSQEIQVGVEACEDGVLLAVLHQI